MQPDGRARDAWLRECRRRTAMYYDNDGYRHHRRHDRHDRHDRQWDRGYEGGYDYCEAYFDDYYRTYTQPGYGYGYGYPQMGYVLPVPMMMQQQVYQTRQPVEEVVTEEYVPMRSRIIERRPARRIIRDKRIRVAP